MGHTAGAGMDFGAAQIFNRDLLAGHRPDDLRSGQEHVALAGHDDEVGQRRRVHGATGAGSEDDRNLRDDPRGLDIAHENLAIGGQTADAFLNPRTARVAEADAGNAGFQRLVHDAADLLRLNLGEGAAQYREVLRVNRHPTSVDLAKTGDHRITGKALLVQAKGAQAMRRHHAEFMKRSFVEQQIDPLARRQFASCVLLVNALLPTAQYRLLAQFAQCVQVLLCLSAHPSSFRRPGLLNTHNSGE